MDSLEKTRAYIDQLIDEKLPAHIGAFASSMVDLPETATELDRKLEQLARECLALRSDDIPQLQVSECAAAVS